MASFERIHIWNADTLYHRYTRACTSYPSRTRTQFGQTEWFWNGDKTTLTRAWLVSSWCSWKRYQQGTSLSLFRFQFSNNVYYVQCRQMFLISGWLIDTRRWWANLIWCAEKLKTRFRVRSWDSEKSVESGWGAVEMISDLLYLYVLQY